MEGGSNLLEPVKSVGDVFTVEVDLHHFIDDEISVKIVDDTILVVEARHDERCDPDHGPVSRHFLHRYRLPSDVHPQSVKSELTTAGILTITASKTRHLSNSSSEVVLPIARKK